jgi:hypothetical protein
VIGAPKQHSSHTRDKNSCQRWDYFFLNFSRVLSLYFFRTCCFILIVLACSFVFTAQHTTQTCTPPEGFFVFSCTLYFNRTCFFVLSVLHFAFCLDCTTQTEIPSAGFEPAPPPPSNRSATDPRLRPLGLWNRSRLKFMNVILKVQFFRHRKHTYFSLQIQCINQLIQFWFIHFDII